MRLKWNSTTGSRLRHGLKQIDWELVLAVGTVILMIVLALSIFVIGFAQAV